MAQNFFSHHLKCLFLSFQKIIYHVYLAVYEFRQRHTPYTHIVEAFNVPMFLSSGQVEKSFPDMTRRVARLIPAYSLGCTSNPFLYHWTALSRLAMSEWSDSTNLSLYIRPQRQSESGTWFSLFSSTCITIRVELCQMTTVMKNVDLISLVIQYSLK